MKYVAMEANAEVMASPPSREGFFSTLARVIRKESRKGEITVEHPSEYRYVVCRKEGTDAS